MVLMAEMFLSGCISKVINDGKDYSWIKIKNVINDRHDQNIHTKIYRVIEKTFNIVTGKKYKDSDVLYDAIEKMFNGFKNHDNTLEAIRCSLVLLCSDVNDQSCEIFLEKFYEEICQDTGLYGIVNLLLQQKEININQEGFQQLNKKVDNLTEIVGERRNNETENNLHSKKIVKNRSQEYGDKWDQNMFLNDFDERDENAGVNIKLSEVYLNEHLPHYVWKNNRKERDDLKSLLNEYVNKNDDSKMLLILGQPGIGKSTLITWIMANFPYRVKNILVYKFASELGNIDWRYDRISNRILDELGLKCNDLNGKTLILDGFDEVGIESKRRRDILDRIYEDWIYNKTIDNFSLIITCRENYIPKFEWLKCSYITLQPWDEVQIRSFCDVFQEKTKNNISKNTMEKLIQNKDILGIPLILYMVLALNISIETEGSIVDIYDKIFSLEGGIYDRCIDNRKFADSHRIAIIKKQIHQISRDIAIWMFENEPEEAYIPQREYQKICEKIADESGREYLEQDSIIGNFYRLRHCEGIGADELCFVHRTIYEYFVIEYIFHSMCEAIKISTEKLAGVFGYFLKKGRLSETTCEFLKYKIKSSELKNKYSIVLDTFNMMLKDGMTYYTGICYKNVMDCEMKIFVNMLEIIHLWGSKGLILNESISNFLYYNGYMGLNLRDTIIQSELYINSKVDGICSMPFGGIYLQEAYMAGIYLKHISLAGANLMLADLEDAVLEGIDLTRADLSIAKLARANLTKAVLQDANLSNADFSGAMLNGAMLVRAEIKDIDLTGADLTETIFDEKQVNELENEYDLSKTSVCLKTDEIISYVEYKQKH